MKKTIVMLATLIMSFAFAISVMAAPSPEDEHDDDNGPTTTSQKKETQEKIDKKTKITEDEFDKDGDNGSSSLQTLIPCRQSWSSASCEIP